MELQVWNLFHLGKLFSLPVDLENASVTPSHVQTATVSFLLVWSGLSLFTDFAPIICLLIRDTEDLLMPWRRAIFRTERWVPGSSSCEKINSETDSIFSSVQADLGLPACWWGVMLPVRSSCFIALFTFLGFQCLLENCQQISAPHHPFLFKTCFYYWQVSVSEYHFLKARRNYQSRANVNITYCQCNNDCILLCVIPSKIPVKSLYCEHLHNLWLSFA